MKDPFEGLDSLTLRKLRQSHVSPEIMRCIRDEIDRRLYYYGDHFKYQIIRDSRLLRSWNKIRNFLGDTRRSLRRSILPKKSRIDIVSSAYFNFNQELSLLGWKVCRPPWNLSDQGPFLWDKELVFEMRCLRLALVDLDFNDLNKLDFISRVDGFVDRLKYLLIEHQVQAVVVPNDTTFFESILVTAARRAGICSAVFIHGFPGRYNHIDDNLADNLLVWGDKIKENYSSAGISGDKIYVVGSARYEQVGAIRATHDNGTTPLVLCKAMAGVPDSPGVRTGDRAFSLMYLDEVRGALLALGVSRCRVRPHPSESLEWYRCHLGTDFFEWDNLPLNESLKKAAYVIGPTSTVLFDSMAIGRPYYVYEPLINGIGYDSAPLFPPFNGTEADCPVAHTPKKLRENITAENHAKNELWPKYIAPFDAVKVAQILGLKSPGSS